MKIELWWIGKTWPEFDAGIKLFDKRIKRYNSFEIKTFKEAKGNLKPADAKAIESNPILKQIDDNDIVILLEDKGRMATSEVFARMLETWQMQSGKKIIFIIGGAYGVSEELYQRANHRLSLSPMIFSHQVIRLLFMEQLYRAFTILNNEPYHHP